METPNNTQLTPSTIVVNLQAVLADLTKQLLDVVSVERENTIDTAILKGSIFAEADKNKCLGAFLEIAEKEFSILKRDAKDYISLFIYSIDHDKEYLENRQHGVTKLILLAKLVNNSNKAAEKIASIESNTEMEASAKKAELKKLTAQAKDISNSLVKTQENIGTLSAKKLVELTKGKTSTKSGKKNNVKTVKAPAIPTDFYKVTLTSLIGAKATSQLATCKEERKALYIASKAVSDAENVKTIKAFIAEYEAKRKE